MHRLAKSVIVALLAMMCMGAFAASSASAAVLPLFLTESKKALLFTIDGIGLAEFRAETPAGQPTVKCEKVTGHGFVLDKSPLVDEVNIEFSGKCELQTQKCEERIKLESSLGELGLLAGHVLLLLAPKTGILLIGVKCGNLNAKVNGAVIGEFKLDGTDGEKQYSVDRKDFLLLFIANQAKQNIQHIELLGEIMEGIHLTGEEDFAGKGVAEQAIELILLDGNGLIDP